MQSHHQRAALSHCRETAGLAELLAHSDYVCNVLPSTPLTRGLLSGDVLRHCSAKVWRTRSLGSLPVILSHELGLRYQWQCVFGAIDSQRRICAIVGIQNCTYSTCKLSVGILAVIREQCILNILSNVTLISSLFEEVGVHQYR